MFNWVGPIPQGRNARGHWLTNFRQEKVIKAHVAVAMVVGRVAPGASKQPIGPFIVNITRYHAGNCDAFNVNDQCKAFIDEIAKCMGVNDRTFHPGQLEMVVRRPAGVTIEICGVPLQEPKQGASNV